MKKIFILLLVMKIKWMTIALYHSIVMKMRQLHKV